MTGDKRLYIMIARQMIAGDILKYRNVFFIHGRDETGLADSSQFSLTPPRGGYPLTVTLFWAPRYWCVRRAKVSCCGREHRTADSHADHT